MIPLDKEVLKKTIDELPDDITMEEFAEDLMLSAYAMRVMASPSDGDMLQEDVERLSKSW